MSDITAPALPPSVEVTFIPTTQDYAQATRWITRRALGSLFTIYYIAIISIGIATAFGFVLMFDAAISSPNPTIGNQGMAGAVLFVGVLYLGLFVRIAVKRFLNRRLYIENGYFLATRTMTFDAVGVQNNSSLQQMHIKWENVLGIFDDKRHLFIQIEPAFTLFIPKRIAKDENEMQLLKQTIQKYRAESALKP